MGVKGLKTYIDDFCPDMKKPVNLFDLANQHRRNFKHVTPELVIDGMSFIQGLYDKEGDLESYFGGQWIEFSNILQKFAKRFTDNNIKLVFFFDGCHVQSKRDEWVLRRMNASKNIIKVFDYLKTGKNIKGMPKELQYYRKPTGFSCLSRMTIKLLCPEVEVKTTLNDADVEIAYYARKQKAVFGILSQDTDFIIFDTKPHFSVDDLNYDTMCTKMFDQKYLCDHLKLKKEQLPLFSCLMGNDFVPKHSLSSFHRSLYYRQSPVNFRRHQASGNGTGNTLAEQIASLINKNRWEGIYSDELFSDERFSQGIAMYKDFSLPIKIACIVGKHHVDSTNTLEIYNIYKNKIYDSSEVMEDGMDKNLLPTNLIYRRLRQRLYSIIFHNNEEGSDSQILVKEWCAYCGHDMKTPENIHPEPIHKLKNLKFSMVDLWREKNSIKLQYFMACLNINLSEKDLKTIEPKFAIFCCIINYLLKNFKTKPLLKKFEVIAFISQAVYIQGKTPQEIHNIENPGIDTRAIHICSIFMKGVTEMILALGVCGYPIECENAMPWNYFDGKVFHKMYESAKKNVPVLNMIGNEKNDLKLYNALYDNATKGVKFDERED